MPVQNFLHSCFAPITFQHYFPVMALVSVHDNCYRNPSIILSKLFHRDFCWFGILQYGKCWHMFIKAASRPMFINNHHCMYWYVVYGNSLYTVVKMSVTFASHINPSHWSNCFWTYITTIIRNSLNLSIHTTASCILNMCWQNLALTHCVTQKGMNLGWIRRCLVVSSPMWASIVYDLPNWCVENINYSIIKHLTHTKIGYHTYNPLLYCVILKKL